MTRPASSLLLLLALGAPAQPPAPLTLADCLRLASSVPSPVSIARQEARIAALSVTAARANFLPQSAFSGGMIYNTPRADRQAFVSFNGAREYIAQLGVALELDTSGRLRAAYARAKTDRDSANTAIALNERDLRRAITQAFYRALLTRKLAAAAQASLAESQSFETRVTALVKGGEAAQADLIKAQSQVAAFDQFHRAATLDARLANQELASFWTTDVDTTLNLADDLDKTEPPPTEPPTAYLRRAEFRLFDLQKLGFTLDAKRERAALLPQVNLGYQYGLDANQFRWRERGAALVATVHVPIFDWFRARSTAQQFTEKAQQIEATRKITERAFSRELESAKARLASIQEQLTLAQSQVDLSEKNYKLARLRYEGGEGPALDVVLAQAQLQQARANHFNTLFQFVTARADLEVAAGR